MKNQDLIAVNCSFLKVSETSCSLIITVIIKRSSILYCTKCQAAAVFAGTFMK